MEQGVPFRDKHNTFEIFVFNFFFLFRIMEWLFGKKSRQQKINLLIIFTLISISLNCLVVYNNKTINHFEMMEITRHSTDEQIKQHFEQILKQFNDPNKAKRFRQEKEIIKESYFVLKEKSDRQFYDKFGIKKQSVYSDQVQQYTQIIYSAFYYFSIMLLSLYMTSQRDIREARKWHILLNLLFFFVEYQFILQQSIKHEIFDFIGFMTLFEFIQYIRIVNLSLQVATSFGFELFQRDQLFEISELLKLIADDDRNVNGKQMRIASMLESITEEKIARKIQKKTGVSYLKMILYYLLYATCLSISLNGQLESLVAQLKLIK